MEFTFRDFVSSIMNFNYHQGAHNCVLNHHHGLAKDPSLTKTCCVDSGVSSTLLRYLNIITCKAAIMPSCQPDWLSCTAPAPTHLLYQMLRPVKNKVFPTVRHCAGIFIVIWLWYWFVILWNERMLFLLENILFNARQIIYNGCECWW